MSSSGRDGSDSEAAGVPDATDPVAPAAPVTLPSDTAEHSNGGPKAAGSNRARRRRQRRSSWLAKAVDSALLLAVLTGIALIGGAYYYDGYFDYFGIKSYQLEIPMHHLVMESLEPLWLAFLAVGAMLTTLMFRDCVDSRRWAYFYLLVGITGCVVAYVRLEHVRWGSWSSLLPLVGAIIPTLVAVIWFKCPEIRIRVRVASSDHPALLAALMVLVLVVPCLFYAHPLGRSLAMRSTTGEERLLRVATEANGRQLEEIQSGVPLLVLARDGTVTVVMKANPPPEVPEVVVLGKTSYGLRKP